MPWFGSSGPAPGFTILGWIGQPDKASVSHPLMPAETDVLTVSWKDAA